MFCRFLVEDWIKASKTEWNEVQQEVSEEVKTVISEYIYSQLKYCGVDNVKDWAGNDFNWTPSSANKPSGCCRINQEGAELTEDEQLVRVFSPGIIVHFNISRSAEMSPKTLRIKLTTLKVATQ